MLTTALYIVFTVAIHAELSADEVNESVVSGIPLWDSETVAAELTEEIRAENIRGAIGKVARAAAEAEDNSFQHVFEVQVDEYDHSARRLLAVTRTPAHEDRHQQVKDGLARAESALRDHLAKSDCKEFLEQYPGRDIDEIRSATLQSAVFHGAMRLPDDSVIVVLGTGVDTLASRWKAAEHLVVVAGDVGRWRVEQEMLARASWGLIPSGDWFILADAANKDEIAVYGISAMPADPRSEAFDAVEKLAISDDLTDAFSVQWRGVATSIEQVIHNSCLPGVDLASLQFRRPAQPVDVGVVFAYEMPDVPPRSAQKQVCLAVVLLRQEHARVHDPSAEEAIRHGLSEIYKDLDTQGMWIRIVVHDQPSVFREETGSGVVLNRIVLTYNDLG